MPVAELVTFANIVRHSAGILRCIRVVENFYPYLKHRYIDLRCGRRQTPYTLRLRNGLQIGISEFGHDWYSVEEVFLQEAYTAAGQRILPGDTVVDVGANIGCFSLLASRRVGPGGRVIALEPDPATFARLEANIRLNKADNVRAIPLAVGEQRGEAPLFQNSNSLFSSLYPRVDGRPASDRTAAVRIDTLDHLFTELDIRHCHYLKLDCEGAEYGIVRSLTPATAAVIEQITVEKHRVANESEAEFDSRLVEQGFELISDRGLSFYSRRKSAHH